MPSPNQPTFYYDSMNPPPYMQYSPALNNNSIDGSNRINKINKVTNNSINKLFNNNLHFKVTEHFHHLVKDRSRTVDQIYSKWNDMNGSMKKWNGFYQQASMNHKSGEGDEQVVKKAMKDYKIMVKSKGFAHIQAWEMVRDNPLWCDIPPVCCESQSTTKRPKPNESMGSANAHVNINLDRDGSRI
ncbi:hypothetical protein R6Q59_006667 [Mikania micrantha]